MTFTEVFDEAWYAGHALGGYRLHDECADSARADNEVRVTRVRDEVLRSGFETGIEKSNERLDAIFAS